MAQTSLFFLHRRSRLNGSTLCSVKLWRAGIYWTRWKKCRSIRNGDRSTIASLVIVANCSHDILDGFAKIWQKANANKQQQQQKDRAIPTARLPHLQVRERKCLEGYERPSSSILGWQLSWRGCQPHRPFSISKRVLLGRRNCPNNSAQTSRGLSTNTVTLLALGFMSETYRLLQLQCVQIYLHKPS